LQSVPFDHSGTEPNYSLSTTKKVKHIAKSQLKKLSMQPFINGKVKNAPSGLKNFIIPQIDDIKNPTQQNKKINTQNA
jgi:hypothetical protein